MLFAILMLAKSGFMILVAFFLRFDAQCWYHCARIVAANRDPTAPFIGHHSAELSTQSYMSLTLRAWLKLAASRRVRKLGICTCTFALANNSIETYA